MLKKEVSYMTLTQENGEIIEKEITKTVYFFQTVKTMFLFEEATGKNFLDFQEFVVKEYMKKLSDLNINDIDNLTINQQMGLLELLLDSKINEFMYNYAMSAYGVYKDGIIQNEVTFNEAKESLWLPQIIGPEFFQDIMNLMNKGAGKNNNSDNDNNIKKN